MNVHLIIYKNSTVKSPHFSFIHSMISINDRKTKHMERDLHPQATLKKNLIGGCASNSNTYFKYYVYALRGDREPDKVIDIYNRATRHHALFPRGTTILQSFILQET